MRGTCRLAAGAVLWTAAFLLYPIPSARAAAKGVRIELRGGLFLPFEKAFRDIYGQGPGLGADLVIGILDRVDVWIGGSNFDKKGRLSFTAEETTVKIRTLGWGVRYRYPLGRLDLYAGAGLHYFLFDEENPIGDVSTSKIGPEARAGVFFRMTRRFSAGAFLGLTRCAIWPAQHKVNIGGLSAGLSLAYLI